MVVLNAQEESPTRTSLEIEVPGDEVEKAWKEVTRAYAKRAALPGFRKGHAPESVVRKRFADEIRSDVLEHLLPGALSAAVEEKKLSVLGRPHIDALNWDPPGPIRFTAKLDLKPPIELGEYRGLPVQDVDAEPTEEEVARVIQRFREQHAEFHPVEGRSAAAGDYAVADVAGTFIEILEPGQNPRTFRDEKVTLEVGHPDSMAEINDALRGASTGETRRFRKTFPDDFPNEEFKGKTVDYELTLAALKEKKVPELDDDLAKQVAEGETAESLRQKVQEGLRHEKEAERRRSFRRSILDQLLAQTPVAAPEVLVESEIAGALRDYARYLANNRVDPKEADWDKLREDSRDGAVRRVQEYLLIDEIARREGIEVNDTELEAEFKRAAARRGADPAELREQMSKGDGLEALRDEMRLARAIDLLISQARVLPSGSGIGKRDTGNEGTTP
ncbi:MAG: trigger factor [Acidobacteria bacterium]|nr:trigger factor [Acidobacteriota bacterium]MCA1612003.1 trigger factor [Acidobacteriota bacterium]